MDAHHQPWEVSSTLHRESADEEVQDCSGEDHEGRHVVQVVQTVLQGAVIQVPTACLVGLSGEACFKSLKMNVVPVKVSSVCVCACVCVRSAAAPAASGRSRSSWIQRS